VASEDGSSRTIKRGLGVRRSSERCEARRISQRRADHRVEVAYLRERRDSGAGLRPPSGANAALTGRAGCQCVGPERPITAPSRYSREGDESHQARLGRMIERTLSRLGPHAAAGTGCCAAAGRLLLPAGARGADRDPHRGAMDPVEARGKFDGRASRQVIALCEPSSRRSERQRVRAYGYPGGGRPAG